MKELKVRSLKLNGILNITKTFMSLIFPLITFPYVSRILGPENLGRVSFAQSIVGYFSLFASLGITSYGIREAAAVRNNKILLSTFVREIFIINCMSTLFAYGLLSVSIFIIPKFSTYRKLLVLCSSSILFVTLGLEWLYSALEDYLFITIRSIIFQIVTIALMFVLVKKETDYYQYAALGVISNVGSNICNFIHARKYITLKIYKKIELKKHFKPIFSLFTLALVSSVYTLLDTTMLGFLSDDRAVGIYSAATKINRIVLSLVVSIGAVVLPRLSYLINDSFDEFKKLAMKSAELIFMLGFPCTIGLCILAKPIISIITGVGYFDAIIPMRILNPIIIIIGLSNFTGVQIFMPLKKEKWTLYSVIAGAIINFSLNVILIPKLNVIGASIGTLCAETTVTIVQLFLARKIISVSQLIKKMILYWINSMIMGAFVYIVYRVIDNNIVNLLISTLSGGIIYVVLLIIEKNTLISELLFSKFFRKREKNE